MIHMSLTEHLLLLLLGLPEFSVQCLLLMKCCNSKVVTCFKKICQQAIEDCRHKFYELKTETQHNQFLLDYLIEHSRSDKSILHAVSGQVLCEKSWRLVYGIRYCRFQSVKEKFFNDVVQIEHGLTGRLKPQESTLRLQSWMRTFFQKVGDRMPMSEAVHLPSCLTKVGER